MNWGGGNAHIFPGPIPGALGTSHILSVLLQTSRILWGLIGETGSWPGSKTNVSAWWGRSPGAEGQMVGSAHPAARAQAGVKWGKAWANFTFPKAQRCLSFVLSKDPPVQQIVAKQYSPHPLKSGCLHKHIWHERAGESPWLYVWILIWWQ